MRDDTTQTFLDLLHRGGAYSYWWTLEGQRSDWWEVGKQTPLPGGRRNIYVGVHPTSAIPPTNAHGKAAPPTQVRAQLGSIAAINCLFAEYDAKDFQDDKRAAQDRVDSLEPPPSVVVDSGGGYHCYWLLAEPFLLDSELAHARARKLQAAWVRLQDGDPQSKDLARVLRVPGTYNYKYTPARTVAIVRADFERLYAIDELAALAQPFLERDAPAAAAHTNGTGDTHAWLTAALAGEIAKVARCVDGSKHEQLLDSAIALGGLVHLGLDERTIEDGLYAAIEGRAQDKKNARQTILDGIGYGKARPRDIPPPKVSAHAGNSAHSAYSASGSTEPWGRMVSFDDVELPAFPSEIFPDWLRAFVDAVAESTQTPLDLSGMLALAVLATCAQRWIMVEPRQGWIEPTNLFVVVALPPASRKSAVFRAFVAPLLAYEQQQASEAKRRIAETETLRDILEERLSAAKRDAAKARNDDSVQDALDRANDLAGELAELQTPAIPRLIVDDVTPEALATLLAEQGGRMAALSPEGDVFAIMAGRYSGTSGPNFGVFLKGHAGDTLRVDRRTRSEFVDWPALTLGITTQPDVVRGLAEKAGFRGQGLLGRFLYALPASLIGRRRIDAPAVPEAVRQAYHTQLAGILQFRAVVSAHSAHSADTAKESLIDDSTSIYIYKISAEASILLNEFLAWLEPHLATDAAFGSFADWAGKLAGATLRVAALLHMAETIPPHNSHNSQKEISAETLGAALRLAHYLLAHARAAFQEMGADAALMEAKRVLAWIEQEQLHDFTKRDVFNKFRRVTGMSKADDFDPVLKVLCDYGYIRPIDTGEPARRGRPASQRYEVHPEVLKPAHNAHNAQNSAIPNYTFALPMRGAGVEIDYAAVRHALALGQEGSVRTQCERYGFDADAVIAAATEAAG